MNLPNDLARKLLDALIHATSCVENNYYPARGTKDWNMLIVELDRMLAEAAVAEQEKPAGNQFVLFEQFVDGLIDSNKEAS